METFTPAVFRSFHQALTRLEDTPYDVSWLTGCLVNIASPFVHVFVESASLSSSTSTSPSPASSSSPASDRLSTLKLTASNHLREFGKVDHDTPPGAVEAIDIDELVVFVKRVYEECMNGSARIESPNSSGAQNGNEEQCMSMESCNRGVKSDLQELAAYVLE
jgi:hypothetical protein